MTFGSCNGARPQKQADLKDDNGDWGISSSKSRQNKDEIPHPGEREKHSHYFWPSIITD
jgi:hypothetical protein